MSLSLRRRLELELASGRVTLEEAPLVHEPRADDVEGGGEEAGREGRAQRRDGVVALVVFHQAVLDERRARVVVRRELQAGGGAIRYKLSVNM